MSFPPAATSLTYRLILKQAVVITVVLWKVYLKTAQMRILLFCGIEGTCRGNCHGCKAQMHGLTYYIPRMDCLIQYTRN